MTVWGDRGWTGLDLLAGPCPGLAGPDAMGNNPNPFFSYYTYRHSYPCYLYEYGQVVVGKDDGTVHTVILPWYTQQAGTVFRYGRYPVQYLLVAAVDRFRR